MGIVPYNLRFTISVGADIIRLLIYNLYVQHYLYADTARRVPTIRGLPVLRDDVGIVPYKLRFIISVYLRDDEGVVPYNVITILGEN